MKKGMVFVMIFLLVGSMLFGAGRAEEAAKETKIGVSIGR